MLKINVKDANNIRTLEASGEIDFYTSRELREKFQQALDKKISKLLVDLKKVTYIDSSGLATFVETLQRMNRTGGRLVLMGLAPAVRSVFEIAKLDSIFVLAETEEGAVAALAG